MNEVYNLAAQSHVGISFSQPLLTWDVTAKGCINILQSIVDLGLKDVRFYQASSREMFGANYSIATDLNKYQDEKTQFLPQSPYAVAKVAAHNSVRLYRESYGVHGSCGILFNHESPVRGENFVTRKITKWIGEFRRWLDQTEFCFRGTSCPNDKDYITCHGKPFRSNEFPRLRLGNLDAYRDWGFAGDYVEAMWLMLQQEKPDDYVICTEHTYSVRDFVQTAFQAANKISGNELFTSNYMDYIIIDPAFYRPAEVDYLRGRCSKAKKSLGWSPRHSFEDLVNMMVSHDI